jgi:hypothetical protein
MVNWQVREVEPSSPSRVEVKNERNCTSASPPTPTPRLLLGRGHGQLCVPQRLSRGSYDEIPVVHYSSKDLPCCKLLRNVDL